MRAMESVGPPAENATTSVMGRDGKVCAPAMAGSRERGEAGKFSSLLTERLLADVKGDI